MKFTAIKERISCYCIDVIICNFTSSTACIVLFYGPRSLRRLQYTIVEDEEYSKISLDGQNFGYSNVASIFS